MHLCLFCSAFVTYCQIPLGFNNYMTHAYPEDELNPIQCKGRSRDTNIHNWNINDVLGNFSLTLIDSLDTLAVNCFFDQSCFLSLL